MGHQNGRKPSGLSHPSWAAGFILLLVFVAWLLYDPEGAGQATASAGVTIKRLVSLTAGTIASATAVILGCYLIVKAIFAKSKAKGRQRQ